VATQNKHHHADDFQGQDSVTHYLGYLPNQVTTLSSWRFAHWYNHCAHQDSHALWR